MDERIRKVIDKDRKRRDTIYEIYTDIEDVLQMDVNLRRVLTTEFDDETKDLEKLRLTLIRPECPILVLGETTAGKSSLINLLIGRAILPVKLLSCTSAVCKIWNSDERKIILTNLQGEQEEHLFNFDEPEEKMKKLLLDKTGQGSEDTNLKYVDIYLPIPMLEKHISIVDTPGISELDNTTLMDRLFEYLPNAIAIIYVIDASSAGGLFNDRWIKKIVSKIKEQQDKGNMLDFQTKTMLFVCNKWDAVEQEEEKDVLDFILLKLQSIWPNLNPEKQVFKLSCRKERKNICKMLPPTQKFANLVETFTNMMPQVLDAKMVRHVRWQKHVVQTMIDRLASKIATSKQIMDERERGKTKAEARLHLLEEKLNKVKISALSKVNEKGEALANDIVKHLKSSSEKICSWKESEIPKSVMSPDNLPVAINLIRDRIENEITVWSIQNKDRINNEFEEMIKNEFMILEEDLSFQSDQFESKGESLYDNLTMLSAMLDSPLDGIMTLLGVSVLVGTLFWPLLISIPVIFGFYLIDKYEKTALEFMTDCSQNVLKHYVTENYISGRIELFLNNMKNKITHIYEKVVQKKINADKIFIADCVEEKMSASDIMRQCHPLQSRCEMLLGKIEILLVEHFPEREMSFQYIHNAKFQHEIGHGAFSNVHSAIISLNDKETLVAVKTFKKTLEGMYSYKQLSEALILRTLKNRHQNIMKMYGISLTKCDGRTFLQIFLELCEDSLHNIVMKKQKPIPCGNFKRFSDCKSSWSFVKRIMEGICSAIEYMHGLGFVHRDLKLENILVKESHEVRLGDFGHSKREDILMGTISGTQLHMSPEVMMGKLHYSEADIYSLGMVLYELWYYRPVFSRPSPSNPSGFEYLFHTGKELKDSVVLQGQRPDCKIPNKPPKEITALMTRCWEADIEQRPTAAGVYKLLCEVIID